MDSKILPLVLALVFGIAGAFLLLDIMGSSGILPASFPLMSS